MKVANLTSRLKWRSFFIVSPLWLKGWTAISLSFNPNFRARYSTNPLFFFSNSSLFSRYGYSILCVLSFLKQPLRHFRLNNIITKPVSTGFQALCSISIDPPPQETTSNLPSTIKFSSTMICLRLTLNYFRPAINQLFSSQRFGPSD